MGMTMFQSQRVTWIQFKLKTMKKSSTMLTPFLHFPYSLSRASTSIWSNTKILLKKTKERLLNDSKRMKLWARSSIIKNQSTELCNLNYLSMRLKSLKERKKYPILQRIRNQS
jgi:hypothetical protein